MKLFNTLLYIHIACGGISLLSGLITMIATKGNQLHKKIGEVFFYSLTISSLISIPMTYVKSNYFLFLISIFTLYMLLTGKRCINMKLIKEVGKIDWLITAIMTMGGIGFIIYAIVLFITGNTFGIVLFVFGSLGLLFSLQDYKNFTGKSKIRNWGTTTHIQRMVGSYIASSTAFLVVNNKWLSAEVGWLLPTLLLTPLIIRWSRMHKKLI